MRNRLYPDEYPTHAAGDGPTPFDTPDAKTRKTELERIVDEIRHTSPPTRDASLAASPDVFDQLRSTSHASGTMSHTVGLIFSRMPFTSFAVGARLACPC
jgi:hypothetical protein